jgi:hypothetical protein
MNRYLAISAVLLSLSVAGSPAGPSGSPSSGARAAAGRSGATGGIVHRLARVKAANEDWLRTGVRVEPGDVVVLSAKGSVRTSEISGAIGPNGFPSGDGKLEAMIGSGKAFAVGSQAAVLPGEAGLLKLRVQDDKYVDNAGGFDVHIILIPAALIPEASPVSEQEE